MKRIEALIRPDKLREVKDALAALAVDEIIVSRVRGFGRQHGHKEWYRGAEYSVEFVSMTRLDVLVSDPLAGEVVETILKTARTGKAGDGMISVRNYADAVPICVDDEVGVDDQIGVDDQDCLDDADKSLSQCEQMSAASFVTILSKLLGPALRLLARIVSISFSA